MTADPVRYTYGPEVRANSPCFVCRKPEVAQINRLLESGYPVYYVATVFEVDPRSLSKHLLHFSTSGARALETDKKVPKEDDLIQRAHQLWDVVWEIIEEKRGEKGSERLVLNAARQATSILGLWAELRGRLSRSTEILLLTSPSWNAAKRAILDALAPWPEARKAVIEALERELGAQQVPDAQVVEAKVLEAEATANGDAGVGGASKDATA